MATPGFKNTVLAKCNVYIHYTEGVYPETLPTVPTWVIFSVY